MLADVNWDELKKAHVKKNALATLLLRHNVENGPYSEVMVNREQRITALGNMDESSGERLMFTGVSILSPEILDRLPSGRPVDIVKELYVPMIQSSDRLYGHRTGLSWQDAGTLETYHATVMRTLGQGQAVPADTGITFIPPVYIEDGCTINDGADYRTKLCDPSGCGGGERIHGYAFCGFAKLACQGRLDSLRHSCLDNYPAFDQLYCHKSV